MHKQSADTLLLIVFFISILAISAVAMDKEIAVEVWKKAADSTISMGEADSTFNIETVRTEAIQGGLRFVLDAVDSEGKTVRSEFAVRYDGKDYPVTGLPDADTVYLKRIDDYAFDCSYKKNGKVTKNERIIVSKDGRRATVFKKENDLNPMDFTIVSVWDKQ